MRTSPLLLAIMGPTGSGKSDVAEVLADRLSAALINADAFQVYRGLDVGTNKPKDRIRYRLLDIKHPADDFGVGEWVQLAQTELESIWADGASAIVVGGSGFYVRALFEQYDDLRPPPNAEVRDRIDQLNASGGLDAMLAALRELNPAALDKLDSLNPARVRRSLEREMAPGKTIQIQLPPFRKLKFALNPPTDQLAQRLQDRVSELLNAGWREEVEGLLMDGIEPDCPAFRAIGYHCIVEWTQGKSDKAKVTELITNATRQYAKKQRTWLRAEPNVTAVIEHDIGPGHAERAATTIEQIILSLGQHDG